MSAAGTSTPTRVAVVGVGHHGRHHARVYAELPEAELVAVVDRDASRAAELADQYGCRAVGSVEDILDEVEAVSVVVPTIHHVETSRPFIERGIPVLIEKPIAADVSQAAELVDLARTHDCPVAVGHIERFNPVVQAMRRFDVEPKFIETHRISPFTFRSADVGVVFDMMIHDIDIVLSLVRDEPERIDAIGVRVLGRSEDICNARVTFKRGCVVNLTASRLALKTERKIRVFSEEAYLSLDYQKRVGLAVRKKENLDILEFAKKLDADDLTDLTGADYTELVHVEPLMPSDDVEPLKSELASFLRSVRLGEPPEVTLDDGVAALKLASDIVAAVAQHAWDGSSRRRVGPDAGLCAGG